MYNVIPYASTLCAWYISKTTIIYIITIMITLHYNIYIINDMKYFCVVNCVEKPVC